jgi:hypothetical protein|tara:strand:+ start:735 stop:1016 length:282 start_codon:yes stop_codon:yes gene_type:complete
MPGKKKTKVVPKINPVKMQSNPLSRINIKTKSKSNSNTKTKNLYKNVKMRYNPVRDCGSIGGTKKTIKKKTRKKKTRKKKKKDCGCSKMWFIY